MSAGLKRRTRCKFGRGVYNNPTSYPLTATNFPCLIEAFTADGISGNDNVGALGTVTLTPGGGWTQPAPGQFRRNSFNPVTVSGAWTAIGSRHALLIAIGNFTNSLASFCGNGVAALPTMTLSAKGAASTLALSAGNNATMVTTTLTGSILGAALRLDQSTANGHGYTYFIDATTSEGPIQDSAVTGDISNTWGAFPTGAAAFSITNDANSYFTGIFLLAFNSFPSDIDMIAALTWMGANPKKLYPGFYHRS